LFITGRRRQFNELSDGTSGSVVSSEVNCHGLSPSGDVFFISVFVKFHFQLNHTFFVGRLGLRFKIKVRFSVYSADVSELGLGLCKRTSGISGTGLLQAGCASCHPTIGVKTLKDHEALAVTSVLTSLPVS